MARLSLLLLFFVCSFLVNAQTGIYRTYEDYINNKLEDVGELSNVVHVQGEFSILFKRNDEKIKVKCEEIWGFKYKNELFRVDHETQQPYYVYSIGKIIYYENGLAYLEMLRFNKDFAEIEWGGAYALSKTMNSDMVITRQQWKKFLEGNPELKDILYCLNQESYSIKNNRECVKKFEENK